MQTVFLELKKSVLDSKNPEIIFKEVENYIQNQSKREEKFIIEQKLRNYLESKKSIFTFERQFIFQEICSHSSQFTIEEIYFKILNKMHISRTTIQTTISLFEASGIIKKLNPENKRFSTNYYILK